MIDPLAFIAAGILIYLSAAWVGRLFSDFADRSERDGVIRYGSGLGNKVWREDSPAKFASRIDTMRFSATFGRWFLRVFGAIFAFGGAVQLVEWALK